METLRGKTALVTGASRGIGVHLARALAAEGMNLVLAARSADALSEVCSEIEQQYDVRAVPAAMDIANVSSLQRLVDVATGAFGRIDVLVNNAGLDQCLDYTELDAGFIERVIAVNLTAPMVLTRLVLPEMIARGEGHIVNLASLAGLCGTPYNETYSATKHGLVGFTRSLRLSLAAEGHAIGASAICPGFVSDTGMFQTMVDQSNVSAPAALGVSTPAEVARAMLRAIRHDTAEAIVNSTPVRPMLMLALLLPRLGEWLTRRLGVVKTFKQVASSRPPEPSLGPLASRQ